MLLTSVPLSLTKPHRRADIVNKTVRPKKKKENVKRKRNLAGSAPVARITHPCLMVRCLSRSADQDGSCEARRFFGFILAT